MITVRFFFFLRFSSFLLNPLSDYLIILPAELYSNFSQTVLSTLLSTTATSPVPSPQACLATLELLNFRMARLRSLSDSNKISTLPFETFVACHVTFRPLLQSFRKSTST